MSSTVVGVAVVTDSTSYLPREQVVAHGIEVVPLQVVLNGTSYDEAPAGVGEGSVLTALRAGAVMTTSRPPPAAFTAAYERAIALGCSAIVSVHLSSQLSGTVESARLAAETMSVPTVVVDSRSLGMGLGFAVLAAAAAAAEGLDAEGVAEIARSRAAASSAFFYVDSLEPLRRGGRIGTAAALIGSALAVKPLLALVDGRVEMREKLRTAGRAVARLEELAVSAAGARAVDLAVHHLGSPDKAAALAERLHARLPGSGAPVVAEVGAVVGTHVGPGMLAVIVAPREV